MLSDLVNGHEPIEGAAPGQPAFCFLLLSLDCLLRSLDKFLDQILLSVVNPGQLRLLDRDGHVRRVIIFQAAPTLRLLRTDGWQCIDDARHLFQLFIVSLIVIVLVLKLVHVRVVRVDDDVSGAAPYLHGKAVGALFAAPHLLFVTILFLPLHPV